MRFRSLFYVLAVGLLLGLWTPATTLAAVTITRAELNGGQLRVEGQGAVPNAGIAIDGVPRGTADSTGRFRIEVAGFRSATCRITVDDGTTSATATLAGCTPSAPSGSPTATRTPAPTATPQATTSPLTITTTSLPDGNVGTSYGNFITSSGGRGTPHRFKLIAGRLPSGLTMADSFGVQSTSITGTPTTVETTTFTVQVSDQSGNTATKTLSITIHPPLPLVITNGSPTLASGTVGASYANSLFASGGIQPYSWAIVAGQLPPGLSLNRNVISGTPTVRGTFTFTARVTDKGGQQASQQFSITIN